MKKNWLRIGMVIGLVILFGILLVTVMSFKRDRENIDMNLDDSEQDTIVFQNNSSMTEQEIRELVEEKRITLKNFFENAQYYTPSEVSLDHTQEDDAYYIVIGETFLNTLQQLLTETLYQSYFAQFQPVNKRGDINISENLYIGSKDIFENINLDSAIAMLDVSEELLILASATDDTIIGYENIRYCNDEGVCVRDENYSLNLKLENGEWKISNFTDRVFSLEESY